MNSTFLTILLLCTLAVQLTFAFTDDELLIEVKGACPPMTMSCPKAEYAFVPHNHIWNDSAVMKSLVIKQLKEEEIKPTNLKKFLKKTFCCYEGPCMAACGLHYHEETKLAQGFPDNAQQILSLNLPELEPFRKYVEKYIEVNGFQREDEYPAEIEEFLDAITKMDATINDLLSNGVEN
ncbi:unnamed protein product [Caenorhabditis brenneri]